MILTKMLPGHIGGVKELLDICFGESAWSVDMIRAQLEKPDSHSMVALDEGVVVGYLAFEQIVDEGSIVEVAVHPDHRRQGIAQRLIESAIKNAEDLSVVFLEVRESNAPAIALYEKIGFEQIGTRKDYYDNPKENAVIMKNNGVIYENTGNRKQL